MFRHILIMVTTILVIPTTLKAQIANGMTSQEIKLAQEVRRRLGGKLTQPIMHEIDYLARFVRAADNNLDEAIQRVQRCLTWRKEKNMDTIFFDDWSDWAKKYPFTLNMRDYEGRPVLSGGMGEIDIRRIVLGGNQKELDRYLMYGFERGLYNAKFASLQKQNKDIIQGYLFFDMAGYNAKNHACVACVSSWVALAQNYEVAYPHLAYGIYIVNVPRVFQTLFAVIKPFLAPYTANLVNLLDYNKAEWTRELLKIIPKDSLSIEFGGRAQPVLVTSLHDKNPQKYIDFRRSNVTGWDD